nr:unnamed protein product [Callosobruchus analis]
MAFSGAGTPKSNFTTPKRIGTTFNGCTPKSNYTTPKSKRQDATTAYTPECFSNVILETPVRRRISKEKNEDGSNLTVAVRIRPLTEKDQAVPGGASNIIKVRDKELIIHSNSLGTDHIFQYDHIFWSCDNSSPIYAAQEDVFTTIGKPLLNSAFQGYNACLFAYGQTGSGKSFSMMGQHLADCVDIDSEFKKNYIYRIAKLKRDSHVTVEVSYFEIYNEKIHDLLASSATKLPLKVREHPMWGPYVVDLTVKPVQSYSQLRDYLLLGNKNRAIAATTMNEKSSRSHSIFSVELCMSEGLRKEDNRRSKVSLVDLAGSERLGNSSSTDEKMREGVFINKALLTLGKVISALAADQKRNQFVPYRESVLTWLLKESLGGNSLTSMLATISPASTHLEETLSTLRYACQARCIVNRAVVNESPHDKLVQELKLEIERLRSIRDDMERTSMSSTTSSVIVINDSQNEELEDLRRKLTETEAKLYLAQKSWEERFLETKKTQMKELAEVERCKDELESKLRILKIAENDVTLSPYRSNFLEELEGVLTDDQKSLCDDDILEDIKGWCYSNGLICTFNTDSVIIQDFMNRKQACVQLGLVKYNNLSDFINNLTWTNMRQEHKKLSKMEVLSSMNQIYQTLAMLQPADSENTLSLLFAKVNKSLQGFETALLNSIKKSAGQKSVTFNV